MANIKVTLITTLAEFLLDKSYEVYGIKRCSSAFNSDRMDYLYQDPNETVCKYISASYFPVKAGFYQSDIDLA